MTLTYTTIVKKDGDWWIGWIEEVPGVNAQERSKADLLRSLRLILREALEFNQAAAQCFTRTRSAGGRLSRN